MTVDAVLFDLDDTLIYEEDVARTSLRSVAGLFGAEPERGEAVVLATARELWRAGPFWPSCADLGLASWEGLWARFDGCHPSLEGLREWVPSYRSEVWRRSLQLLGCTGTGTGAGADADADAAAAAFSERQRHGHTLRPGATEALHAAGRDHALGLLTNGPPDVQRTKLASCGLEGRFDAVAISGEEGVGKPDPAFFAIVLAQLAVPADRAVMVGDSWERDVVGAERAGVPAIWVSYGRPVPEVRPDVRSVESVADLARGFSGFDV